MFFFFFFFFFFFCFLQLTVNSQFNVFGYLQFNVFLGCVCGGGGCYLKLTVNILFLFLNYKRKKKD